VRRRRLSPTDYALVLAAASELEARRARRDPSAFVDLVFGYRSAAFQRRWHQEIALHPRTVLWAPIEHGKTQQLTVALSLWWLGRDPTKRGVIVGATATAAQKPFGVVKGLIENPPPELRRIFPALRPERGSRAKWTDSAILVAGACATEKDYSLQAVGIEGDVLGSRLDFALLDDILNLENTFTAAQREKVTRWILAVLLGRMLPDSTVVLCGNAWFPDDAMHAMVDHGFHVVRNEAYEETEDGQIVPASILWPERWPLPRLEEMRRTLGTVESWRQLRCRPYAAGEGRFDIRWFDAAFEKGVGLAFVESYRGPWPTFMGVDLGVQQKEKHDKTAFWVMAVDPQARTRIPLNAFEERLTGPAIVERLKDWHRRYGAVIMVENNAAQDFIRQFAQEAGIPTRPFTTGMQKADAAFGIPSLGVELEQGLWRLPKEPAILAWRTQCLAYSPGQHVGDLLMASWFAREAARTGVMPLEGALFSLEKTPAEKLGYGPTEDFEDDDDDQEGGLIVRDDLVFRQRRRHRYGYDPR
jgi:hypothetical protein